ncbi:MAG: DUF2723 domain-containing protein [Anaerolineae bacterium]|nr:DUF2723 domain-containing protein [Anaerolineae bacterium]
MKKRHDPLYGLRNSALAAHFTLNTLIGLLLFFAGLYAYASTLAPTVLEGDKALFQYAPYVLAVTYPTGFPLYLLLGKVWLTIFPFGQIAWRMNLFSAICAAAALPLLYGAIRHLLAAPYKGETSEGSRWAALTAVAMFATLPTFWHWSTIAKTYPLNILLLAGALYLLAIALEIQTTLPDRQGLPRLILFASPLTIPTLFLGLQISVHNTAVLLLPGLLLFTWLNFRQHLLNKKLLLVYTLLLILPGLFYLYIPLRAEWLIAHYGRDEAIQRGLLADFYQSGLAGWVEYFTAARFTGGIVTNWDLIPERFMSVYLPLLANVNNLSPLVLGLSGIGGLALALLRPRIFWPLFLIYIVPIPFVLTYDQGEQSAFLLPSFLMLAIFLGGIIILIQHLLTASLPSLIPSAWLKTNFRPSSLTARLIPPLLFLALVPLLFLPQIRYNFNWLERKWDWAIYNEWSDALNHPLDPNATLLAHWGDLTSFWYLQHAENRRPDLGGLYPPTEEIVADYFARGGESLFIAGPLQGWATGIEQRYQLIPWGRLVRLAPRQVSPETLLPDLPQQVEITFSPVETGAPQLRLIGLDHQTRAIGGSDYGVTLTWQALADLPPETTVSLRLSRGNSIITQLDDTLLSGWFPRDTLPAGQHVLSYAPLPVPLGTLPGNYRLQLVVYTHEKQPWTTSEGSIVLDLAEVEIGPPPAGYQFPAIKTTLAGYDFNGEIELVDYYYSVSRVGQGKGFALHLLWRAITQPVDNYTLLIEQIDATGNVIRTSMHQPVDGQAPTAGWSTGQFVRDQVDVVVPASAPPGEEALRVRLSWQRPDGSTLNLRRWWFPAGDSLDLDWLRVVEKEGRGYKAPQIQYPVDANLANKVRLLGFNTSSLPGSSPDFTHQVGQQDCVAGLETCRLHFDFYWQGLAEMEKLYLVFLHVVNKQGEIVTQHDRSPGAFGRQPTTGWLPGEVITDPIDLQLPADIMPGEYTIYLGMYLPPQGPRLPVWDNQGQVVSDKIRIGQIQVIP